MSQSPTQIPSHIPTDQRSTGTQTEPDIIQDIYFKENVETGCPLKYPEEVESRPSGYIPTCGCNSGTQQNPSCLGKIKTHQVTFECRPKMKDLANGHEHVIESCLLDLCENHYNKIKQENDGQLPTFIGWDTWDAMDTISSVFQ